MRALAYARAVRRAATLELASSDLSGDGRRPYVSLFPYILSCVVSEQEGIHGRSQEREAAKEEVEEKGVNA